MIIKSLLSRRKDLTYHDVWTIGETTGAVARIESGVDELKGKVDRLLEQYWFEHPSKAQIMNVGKNPSSSPPSKKIRSYEARQSRLIGALIVMCQIVAELVRYSIHAK